MGKGKMLRREEVSRGEAKRRRRRKEMMNQNAISSISYLQSCCISTRLTAKLSGG